MKKLFTLMLISLSTTVFAAEPLVEAYKALYKEAPELKSIKETELAFKPLVNIEGKTKDSIANNIDCNLGIKAYEGDPLQPYIICNFAKPLFIEDKTAQVYVYVIPADPNLLTLKNLPKAEGAFQKRLGKVRIVGANFLFGPLGLNEATALKSQFADVFKTKCKTCFKIFSEKRGDNYYVTYSKFPFPTPLLDRGVKAYKKAFYKYAEVDYD